MPGPPPRADQPPVVAFRSVSKVYGTGTARVDALVDVSVDIRGGEFTAVMGPSGSGKSTFMNLAAGLDDPSAGEVWVAGQPLHRMDDDARTLLRREHVGFVFQAFNLVPTLTALENVLLPFDLAERRVTPQDRARVDALISALGLADRIGHRPGQLSGGQQQRVAIARALASQPQIVVADEPTGNLDTRSSREVLALLRTAVREYGQTIAMVSHDPVAASYADRILVIADGRIVDDHGRLSPQQISDLLISLEADAA
ncbi:MAG: ABC transporter ATP-binding protein [Nocardioides sp.]